LTLLLKSLSWLLGHLPLKWVRVLGAGLGRLLGLVARRRSEVLTRIQECLDVPESEAKDIFKRMYRNLGVTAFETLRIPYMTDKERDRIITFTGMDKMKAEKGSFLAAVGHTGNWELCAAATTPEMGRTLNIVVKSLKPESLNHWITTARSHWGTQVHDRRGSVRDLLRILKSNDPIGFIIDQNAKRNWGIFVDFFGKPACTTDGLAQLAAISKCPVFPVFSRRIPQDGSLLVEIGDPIPPPKDRSDEAIRELTQDVTKRLEAFIRQYPDQWIWMHRRWRTQPEES